MKLKQTVKGLVAALVLTAGVFSTVLIAQPASAACTPSATVKCCGGVPTSSFSCTQTGASGNLQDSGLWGILLMAINILTAGVGIAAVGGLVYAGIRYATSAGNAEQAKKALMIITDIVIGVVAYAMMYALLNFLVPGGLFN